MKDLNKRLVENIYFAALYHRDSNHLLMNDLLRDDVDRAKCKGQYDAYAFIVQMCENTGIGKTDYKKVFKMSQKFPTQYP